MALLSEVKNELEVRSVKMPLGASVHLGVFSEPFLGYMYCGRKTLESRVTRYRIAPYGRIAKGDIVAVKRASGPVEAVFSLGDVLLFDLQKRPLKEIRGDYSQPLCADDSFWKSKENCRYAVIMEMLDLVRFEPFEVEKKDRRTWIVLE